MLKIASGVIALIGLSSAAWSGPLSPYYLTAGFQGTNWVVQGSAVINSWAQAHPEDLGEQAIAVDSTVRTIGESSVGSEYTLGGVFTGTTYPTPGITFFDGTTDGTYNYGADYYTAGVYRMDADWSNPVLLFNDPASHLGITYDPSNDSLWVSGNTILGTVVNFSLAGAVLSSFTTGVPITALALDHADGTLWFGTAGTFYQYSKAGVFLGVETYAALASQETLGGEFALGSTPVPEPGAFVLFGAGLAAIALLRRP